MAAHPLHSATVPAPRNAALTPPQIVWGYQWLGARFRVSSSPVPACVGSPHPLSDWLPRMRAAPAAFWLEARTRHDPEKVGPVFLRDRRYRLAGDHASTN